MGFIMRFFCNRLSEFRTVEKYGQDIMEKINDRNQIRRNGGNYNKVISAGKIQMSFIWQDACVGLLLNLNYLNSYMYYSTAKFSDSFWERLLLFKLGILWIILILWLEFLTI